MSASSRMTLALLLSLAICGCRSRESVAEQVFENAARMSASQSGRGASASPAAAANPCAAAEDATVVAIVPEPPGAIDVHRGTIYLAEPTLFAIGPDRVRRELLRGEWLIRDLAVSAAGVFMLTQSDRSPVRTRLVWRSAAGRVVRSMERDDVLLQDVVATDDGAYVLAGRILDSPGLASQLLYFSIRDGASRVVLDRQRGTLHLLRDGSMLYWLEHPQTGRGQSGRSAVVSYRIGDEGARVLLEASKTLSWLALDGDNLYWIERDDLLDETGRLMRMPKTGATPVVLHARVIAAPIVTTHGAVLAHLEGRSRFDAIDRRTGVATRLLDDPRFIARPVVSDGRLYWVSVPDLTSADRTSCIRSMSLPSSDTD